MNTEDITTEYLPQLIKKTANILKRHKSGASSQNVTEIQSKCDNLCIQVTDEVINMKGKNSSNWSHLIPAITRFKNYNSTVALCVWGYALYAAHRWRDRVRLRKAKSCSCPTLYCEHSKAILDKPDFKHPLSIEIIMPEQKKGKILQAT